MAARGGIQCKGPGRPDLPGLANVVIGVGDRQYQAQVGIDERTHQDGRQTSNRHRSISLQRQRKYKPLEVFSIEAGKFREAYRSMRPS